MLNRQKTLLFLLTAAKRPVSKLELTKWAFLLRKEMPTEGGSAFYDFLPYKFGPFSFCLYREMEILIRDGYVEAEDETHWTPTKLAEDATESLLRQVKSDSRRVLHRFSEMDTDPLIDYVYNRFPKFTMNSEIRQLSKRPVVEPAIFTAGYESLSVDAFLNRLLNNGIRRIIDVRNNPIARRYGFHKSTLSKLAGRLQIDYIHIPELGIKSALRQSLNSQNDYKELFSQYEETTLKEETDAINNVASLMQATASVLVCMEADPQSCHRTRLANQVSEKTGLSVIDLGGCCA